ncbi:cardiolipin synthase [Geomonas azotofigens]|uniref:cardiolipin synthase n=1 Tax=Geomonas azotofigens TaxID=2843196 RepID=UPI001C117823|nr:cardiolipin synthase [Geomonas azotofigens]MBU5611330.1 cardiolipin synthase [Geomonas azotofigens]
MAHVLDHIFTTLLLVSLISLAILSAGHALINKRDPRSALGWIITCLAIPFFGPIFYWGMGVNRIYSRAKRWHREAGPAPILPQAPADLPPTKLPGELSYLRELRNLSERVVSTRLLPGNHLVPLENGEEAYPAMLAAIDAAQSSVHLSTYIFDGDETGKRFIRSLTRAANRGVEVRVIVDSLGEKYSVPTAGELLKGSKVEFRRFLPLRPGGYLNLRNHRKIIVVDGAIGFTGGMNIGSRHMVTGPSPVVKDLHFQVTGPVVADLQRTFLEDWHFAKGKQLTDPRYFPDLQETGTALVRAVSDGPDKEFRKLNWIILGALSCARRTVTIVTPYFIPDRALISALITAALRGVEITLVLPEFNNLPYLQWASNSYLWELLQQGVRIYAQPAPFVHTKFMVVDRSWSLIGSANLDPRSLRLNFEFNLEVYDLNFAAQLEDRCLATLLLSREITLAEMDARPLPVKLRDAAAKLFSPYL